MTASDILTSTENVNLVRQMLLEFAGSCQERVLCLSIAAASDEGLQAFDDLDDVIDENLLSQALGWIIKQRAIINDKAKLRGMKQNLMKAFEGRALINWALAGLTTNEV